MARTYAKIKFDVQRRGQGSVTYRATLLEGSWPPDDDLVTLADNATARPTDTRRADWTRRHFGGRVVSSATFDEKTVTVYWE